MKKILLAIIILTGGFAIPAQAYEILVVQSSKIRPYEEVLQGFRDVVGRMPPPPQGFKSIYPGTITEFVLSEHNDDPELDRQVRTLDPDLILAIGKNALYRVKNYHHKPIVYLMAPFVDAETKHQANITGVDMNVLPARQLAALTEAIPGIKRVGLVYDPEKTGDLAAEAKDAAKKAEVILNAKEVHAPDEVPGKIFFDLSGEIDAFWMLPDLTVITPETLAALFLFANEDKKPILAFADKYLQNGATVAVAPDVYAMGEQAGEMAGRILTGTDVSEIPVAPAEKISVKVNKIFLKTAGL